MKEIFIVDLKVNLQVNLLSGELFADPPEVSQI